MVHLALGPAVGSAAAAARSARARGAGTALAVLHCGCTRAPAVRRLARGPLFFSWAAVRNASSQRGSLWDNVDPGIHDAEPNAGHANADSMAFATAFATQYAAADEAGAHAGALVAGHGRSASSRSPPHIPTPAQTSGAYTTAGARSPLVPSNQTASTDSSIAHLLAAAHACTACAPDERVTQFGRLQAALSRAYVPVLLPYAQGAPDAPHGAAAVLVLLGTVAEALVALDLPEASVLARKLLVFAQTHVGQMAQEHYEHMAATAGRNAHYKLVLQLVRIAAQGAPLGMPLQYARLLSLSMLHCNEDVFAAAKDMPRDAPVYMHELLVEHFLRQRDMPNAMACLRTLCGVHGMTAYMWKILLSTRHNVYAALQNVRLPECASAEALVTETVRVLALRNALADVKWVLALARIPDPGGATASQLIATFHASMGGEHIAASCETLALTASLYGRLGHADAALAGYVETLHAAPPPAPRGDSWKLYERRNARDARVDALQHALVGATQGLLRTGRAQEAHYLVTCAVGGAPPRVPDSDVGRRLAQLPRHAVEPGTLCTAARLECAAALRDIDTAYAAMRDGVRDRVMINGRVYRALARMVLGVLGGTRQSIAAVVAHLERAPEWLGGAAADRTYPSIERLAKLRRALVSLGFDERVRIAISRAERSGNAAGARTGLRRSARAHGVAEKLRPLADMPIQPALRCAPTSRAPLQAVRAAPQVPPSFPAAHTPPSRAPAPDPVRAAHMRPTAVPLVSHTHALRVFVLCSSGRYSEAKDALVAMQERGVTPRAAHVEPLVHGLCRAGRASEALTIKRLAQQEWHIPPTANMYESLVGAYAAAEDWQMIDTLKAEAADARVSATLLMSDVLAELAARRSSAAQELSPVAAAQKTPVASLRSVAAHYRYLMKNRRYGAAQEYYAACLERGVRPDYALRRMVKRADNWVRKELRRHPDAALEHARQLARANYERSRADTRAARESLRAESAYRRHVLTFIDGVLSGRIERDVRGPIPEHVMYYS